MQLGEVFEGQKFQCFYGPNNSVKGWIITISRITEKSIYHTTELSNGSEFRESYNVFLASIKKGIYVPIN